ncbi:MAG TPA: SUF system Fe-S cluster assembly regulator [Candidatus Sumerlaeota bacterium]|nr:SUF system Fe-S cluster assembly regulator [Candidatus Sumerlaeota bacterium]HPK01079.1 SUF system Fe-S cluster assembly regulator [Candidatus Sumerlaeota bacterium]
MLRLTKAADYGIILLTYMGWKSAEPHNARDLSRAAHLPLPMVSKILKSLARAGILESQRGTKGGYRLARPPARISVAEIITALEGPIALTECVGEVESNCSVERLCPIRVSWHRINHAIRDALAEITLDEMMGPMFPRPADRTAAAGAPTLSLTAAAEAD